MVYLGRIVGGGTTSDGQYFMAYAVSGRSDPSRTRMARILDFKDGAQKVNIGPLDLQNLTDEQRAEAPFIFYNAVISHPIPKGQRSSTDGTTVDTPVFVSNGVQTDAMYRLFSEDGEDSCKSMKYAMKNIGPETDHYKTPRIAGVFDVFGGTSLSIITNPGDEVNMEGLSDKNALKMMTSPRTVYSERHLDPVGMNYVSTYLGNKADPMEVVLPHGEVNIPMGSIDMYGRNAQQIADNLYDWVDQDFVVCSAAAIWQPSPGKWDLAVRNLHE